MSDKNGGPAFPNESHLYSEQRLGMSLRDYFAAKVVAAAISGGMADGAHLDRSAIKLAAAAAYVAADAMLAERAK